MAAIPVGGRYGVEVRQEAVLGAGVEVQRFGTGEESRALVDLVERVRHRHDWRTGCALTGTRLARLTAAVHHGLREGEQRLAGAVHGQHHGFSDRAFRQSEAPLQPASAGGAQLGCARRGRIAAEARAFPLQDFQDERRWRVLGLANGEVDVRESRRWCHRGFQRGEALERVGQQA